MLAYASQLYVEAMYMRPAVLYTLYATNSKGQTGNIITFAQFEEGGLLYENQNLLSEYRDDTESSNESDDNSTLTPLISEAEIDVMSSGNEYDSEPMST